MQELYRRTLATAGALAALATTACGASVAGAPAPTPTVVNAASVQTAFDHSTMKSAHFKLHGTLIHKPSYFPVTGDGVIQLAPREAFLMNLRIQTYSSLGVLKIQDVTVGGKDYTRIGSGGWSSKPTTSSATTPTSYVGEEIMGGVSVWHARSTAVHSTYDMWIRESDGYIVQLALSGTSGDYTMNFDSYNKSPLIPTPK